MSKSRNHQSDHEVDLKRFRRSWSEDQKRLRELLKSPGNIQQAKVLFYNQHAVLHGREMCDDLD